MQLLGEGLREVVRAAQRRRAVGRRRRRRNRDRKHGQRSEIADCVGVGVGSQVPRRVRRELASAPRGQSIERTSIRKMASDATYEELEALYRNFSGDGWTHRDHWLNRSVSYCDWYGIACESGGSRAKVWPFRKHPLMGGRTTVRSSGPGFLQVGCLRVQSNT